MHQVSTTDPAGAGALRALARRLQVDAATGSLGLANQTAKLTRAMIDRPAVVYRRTLGMPTPGIYEPEEDFVIGGSRVLRASEDDDVALRTSGVTVREVPATADALAATGVRARVIDVYSVKPLEGETVVAAARATRRVVVEDHWSQDRLADAALADADVDGRARRPAVEAMPTSGQPNDLLRSAGIDRGAIAATGRALIAHTATPVPGRLMPIATPSQCAAMLDAAGTGGYAPAANVTSSETLNGEMRGFAEAGADGIVQVTTGAAEFVSRGVVADMALGARAQAEYAHVLRDRYPVLIALHTDDAPPDKFDDVGREAAYDPRSWGRKAEAALARRVSEASESFRSGGTSLLGPPDELQRLTHAAGVTGLTSNPTIFRAAVLGSGRRGQRIAALSGRPPAEIYETIAIDDVRAGAGALAPSYDTTKGAEGFVSLEVDPALVDDADGTLAAARELWARINRPNAMIKIPATAAGVEATRRAIADGINVNVTLLFSVARYAAAIDAYLAGLEERLQRGQQVDAVGSVASFFVSRVDSAVDPMLAAARHDELLGRASVANARLAYAHASRVFAGRRFAALRAAGARRQLPLWASTSTRTPATATSSTSTSSPGRA